MSRTHSLLRSLTDQLASVLDPLTGALQSPEAMARLFERLGLFDASAALPLAALNAVQDLRTQLETLAAQDDLDYDAARAALQAADSAFRLAEAVSDVGGTLGAVEGLGRDLLD